MDEYKHEIIIFEEGNIKIHVDFSPSEDTVWLTQDQMAELFAVDRTRIVRHISNIYSENELDKLSTSAENAQVQMEGSRKVTRQVKKYNLDMIISIGYRVKSQRGIIFRKWVNKILKEYMYRGFALDQQRLIDNEIHYKSFTSTVKMIADLMDRKQLTAEESNGLLKVISKYAYALETLDHYDHQTLTITNITKDEKQIKLEYEDAIKAIKKMPDFGKSAWFGKEKDNSFKGALKAIYQTAFGEDVYPSVEEKAAHLLYFIVKDHAFFDGNKRIAAAVFLWFLDIYDNLYRDNGTSIIEDNALVAMVLMIALSHPSEKDSIIKIIVNLINQNN